ncbi:MAG: hypothetical protein Q9227_000279 [Pyrenula ochraceoflavens]
MHELRKETEDIFYHGFENYMKHAFPEDELRPLTCRPLTRDRENPAHIELNDVLGNYSLTLVDSLSTLAVLASSSPKKNKQNKALKYFQRGVKDLVNLYGDGSDGPNAVGTRARGFDLDSKVQVFETVIRGVGGLLSAHLFAVGELPIRGYQPKAAAAAYAQTWEKGSHRRASKGISWPNGFFYDGQLLRLAYDLANRIIPAFYTPTGMPYPRVNLRYGIPFYANSPLNLDPEIGECEVKGKSGLEVTETCTAGAGSLVLEFTVLSRLTGDTRFEDLAKRAFWAVWRRKSDIGLLGAGIDAESGQWSDPYTGIGAGIDSFFEYALKSHILLSRDTSSDVSVVQHSKDPRELFDPLSEEEQSADGFLRIWNEAHSALKRHLYRGPNYQHPHYIQGDLFTGAARAFWIDSLSAYYPGLLTLAGEVEEASEVHLLMTALWNRFSALPERWNAATGNIEGGLGWWGGRPEFIESTWYLYRATKDPWHLHTGEMTLRDIKRRCWAKCGWAGIRDVKSGELGDRMESFFLGETVEYLTLLFDEDHPLNHLDEPFVFTTEGHPLVIPRNLRSSVRRRVRQKNYGQDDAGGLNTCPAPPPPIPLTMSHTAARTDVFHAGSLARLHLMPSRDQLDSPLQEFATDHPSITFSDVQSPSNYTYYPWTLPPNLVPQDAMSSPMPARPTFDISFPSLPNILNGLAPLQRVRDGILINSIGGLRLGMIQDSPFSFDIPETLSFGIDETFRIQLINNLALGKDEKVFLAKDTTSNVVDPTDPNFTRVRETGGLDLVVDIPSTSEPSNSSTRQTDTTATSNFPPHPSSPSSAPPRSALASLISHVSLFFNAHNPPSPTSFPIHNQAKSSAQDQPQRQRFYIPAALPTGPGTAPIPDWPDAPSPTTQASSPPQPLVFSTVYATDTLCTHTLPLSVIRTHQILLVRRGECSFSDKLENIPGFPPGPESLQLVIVVSFDDEEIQNQQGGSSSSGGGGSGMKGLMRPHLEREQVSSGGVKRRNGVPMVMVGGGERVWEALKRGMGWGVKRRYWVETRGVRVRNLVII